MKQPKSAPRGKVTLREMEDHGRKWGKRPKRRKRYVDQTGAFTCANNVLRTKEDVRPLNSSRAGEDREKEILLQQLIKGGLSANLPEQEILGD